MSNEKISNFVVWEYLKNGDTVDEILEKVPTESRNWVIGQVSSFKYMYEITYSFCELAYYSNIYDDMSQDQILLKISCMPENYQKPLVLLSEGEDISSVVWDIVRPKIINEFKNEE